MAKKPKPFRYERSFRVPIYEVDVRIIVSNDIEEEQARLGCEPVERGTVSAAAVELGEPHGYALLFDLDMLCLHLVAHEVFHLTNMILNYVGSINDPKNDEHAAYLNAWLTNSVMKRLIEIKANWIA